MPISPSISTGAAASIVQARLLCNFQATYTKPNTLSTPTDGFTLSQQFQFANGSGASQASVLYYTQVTIPKNSVTTIDLSNVADSFGNTFSFVTKFVKGLYFQNLTVATGAWLKIAQGASNGWIVTPSVDNYGLFDSVAQGIYLGAGGLLSFTAPTDGYQVPDSSHCTIDLTANPNANVVLNAAIWA